MQDKPTSDVRCETCGAAPLNGWCNQCGAEPGNVKRFAGFSQDERAAIRDGLLGEADIDPNEDPTFPPRIAAAQALIAELDAL